MTRAMTNKSKRRSAVNTILAAAVLAVAPISWANIYHVHRQVTAASALYNHSDAKGASTPTPKRRPASPACEPHFRAALPGGTWTDATKFRRLYFRHNRKAGGTNLRFYLQKVAAHHGIEYAVDEWVVAEDPGSRNASDLATFYVTNLREPVARSISHFKCRWDCNQLLYNKSFVPTEENARKLTDWNQHYGFVQSSCPYKKETKSWLFRLTNCAVDCYSQAFAGLSCPWWDPPARPGPGARPVRREVPMRRQRAVARDKLLRYNLIVVTGRLGDPAYVAALDRLFGVPGSADRMRHPWCELESHYANERVPLVVDAATRANLTRLNALDIGLYREMTDCLDGRGGYHHFPAFEPGRFEANETLHVNYTEFVRRAARQPKRVSPGWKRKFQNNTQ